MTTAILVKAFTKDKAAGNPAGLVLNAEDLTDQQMQHIASELGFSESAFVSLSDIADFRVRFFSPTQEVDFCGHATVATFYALMRQGRITAEHHRTVTQETNIGVSHVTCYADGRIVMAQAKPVFGTAEEDRAKIASLLGIEPERLLDYPLQVVSTGTPKLMIPVDSLKTLNAIQPNLEEIATYCKNGEARGFYPFTTEALDSKADFQARQFNPAAGINEDPITGVAAGALGCYAQKYGLTTKEQIIVEQGYALNMGGQMFVDLSEGVKVGGYAVIYGERELDV
ncbi:MAG TPA: PhzF family phenazine biosynthesis protein [Candidatus Saccharimonadales bacterium]|nr:PhzF family phenazine biosynthesis protein [Candidatus Saccharimonadales bacterium]